MKLNLDFDALEASIGDLKSLAREALNSAQRASVSKINSGYSAVSGLSHMGSNHGQFVSAGAGSAVNVLEQYVQHIDWLQANLDSNAVALGLQESSNSRGVELTDSGGASVSDTVQSIERPSVNFNGFTFFKPVSLPMDIHSLAASLRASQDHQPVAAGKQWIELATQIAQISTGLRSVASQISASNEGAVFDAMLPRIEEVASWGENFAINASQVATDLGRLAAEKFAFQLEAEAVSAQAMAINEPQARVAFESYQALMMHEKLQQTLSRSMPTVSNLMSVPTVSTSVQQAIQTGIDAINGNQQVSGNGLGATGQAIGQVANMVSGAGNFGAVDRGVGDVSGVGANAVPTQAASVATAPTTATGAGAVPAVGGAGSTPSASGVAGAPTSAAGIGGVNGSGVLGAAGNAAGAAGQASRAVGMGMVPGMGAAGAAGNATRGVSGVMTAGRAATGMDGAGGSGRVPAGFTGGYAGAGGAGVSGVGRAGMGGVPVAGGMPGSVAGTNTGIAGGAGTSATASAGNAAGARGGAPMMGGMPMGQGGAQSRGKVKRVSSPLEEDRNVKALLGDRGAVVPGVIGAWVRD